MRLPLFLFIMLALTIVPTAALRAQSGSTGDREAIPDGQFGVGFNDNGGHVQFAFGPNLKIGLNLAIDFTQRCPDWDRETFFTIGPYARLFFGRGFLRTYASAGYEIEQPPVEYISVVGIYDDMCDLPSPTGPAYQRSRLYMAFGAEHFFNRNVGAYAQVDLFTSVSDDVTTDLGFGPQGITAGLELFF